MFFFLKKKKNGFLALEYVLDLGLFFDLFFPPVVFYRTNGCGYLIWKVKTGRFKKFVI